MTVSIEPVGPDVVHIAGLKLPFFIGVHDFEKLERQPVVIDAALSVDPSVRRAGDYVSYATLTEYAIALSRSDAHIELVETLAERLLAKALEDPRVIEARISVTKPDIFPQASGVGITISGRRGASS